MSDYAIFFETTAYSTATQMMGRQSAGVSFMQAIADTHPDHVNCFARSKELAIECASILAKLGAPQTGVAWVPVDQPQRLAEVGLLYRPDPVIAPHAWQRLSRSNPRAYSICGVTHTISTHGPMEAFAGYLTAPLEPWDALICTSRAARDAVRHVIESQAEYLTARVGAVRFTLPQLPVIPLGVHTRHFVASTEGKRAARQRLGLAEDEVVVLFAGRLVVHGKAHPLAMYLALEQASKGRKVVLVQAGRAPSPQILRIFTEEPKRFCPSVRVVMVDGDDANLYSDAWASADIFTSLSDSIQETFGLTPIEAMSAGLPVVVSDWDGYKDTVRNGIDGFRIPTLSLPPGRGRELAERYDAGIENFDYYSGYASQLVAVNVEAAAQAFRLLIDDSELRSRMGAAGAQRAREVYDWKVIFGRYLDLWQDLSERRRSSPQLSPVLSRRQRPDRADPFSMFASYPTHHLTATLSFRRRDEVDVSEIISRRELSSTNFAKAILPPPALIRALLEIVRLDWTAYYEIEQTANVRMESLASALVWLCKVGALDFKQSRPS